MLALKENNIDTALSLLLEHRKEYENDPWISEKLAILYSQNKEWELGWESIRRIKAANNSSANLIYIGVHFLLLAAFNIHLLAWNTFLFPGTSKGI
jgi:hypothetical protein